jgi:hypothetical protein
MIVPRDLYLFWAVLGDVADEVVSEDVAVLEVLEGALDADVALA